MHKAKPRLEETVPLGLKHEITIPRRVSKALKLKKGDHLLLRLVDRRVEMIPVSLIPRDQLWFWTPEWQAKERDVDEDIARGRVKEASSADELLKELKGYGRDRRKPLKADLLTLRKPSLHSHPARE